MQIPLQKNRQEDKYILTQAQYADMLPEVKKHLESFNYDAGVAPKYTHVKSVYMDSPDLVSFKKHVNGEDTRSKIRLRTYENDGGPTDNWYVEIKEKTDGNDSKSRFEVDSTNMAEVRAGKEVKITPTIKALNKKIPAIDLRLTSDRVNMLVKGYNMVPSLTVDYIREAYGTNSVRVTFDRSLSFTAERFKSKEMASRIKDAVDWGAAKDVALQYSPGDVVLEVKYKESLPPWLKEYIEKADLKVVSFSKYVRSCYWLIKGLLGENT